MAPLEPRQRPLIVRVVDSIPVTTWFRPLTGPEDPALLAAIEASLPG